MLSVSFSLISRMLVLPMRGRCFIVLLLRGTLHCFVTFKISLVQVNYLRSCTICPHLQIMQGTKCNCLINFSTLFLSTLTFLILCHHRRIYLSLISAWLILTFTVLFRLFVLIIPVKLVAEWYFSCHIASLSYSYLRTNSLFVSGLCLFCCYSEWVETSL